MSRGEEALVGLALAGCLALPLLEIASRSLLGGGIAGAAPLTQHLTLWVAFLGAALAARDGKLLALATGTLLPEGRFRSAARVLSGAVGAAVSTMLAWASWDLVAVERQAGTAILAWLPAWWAQLVLPFSFAVIALRLAWRAAESLRGRALAALGVVAGSLLASTPELFDGRPAWPALLAIGAATVLGGPIFVVLGGTALFLFLADGIPAAAVPSETYRLAVSATLPAIPLFTLAGFLLAEGEASQRLLRVFRAMVGWVPGGTAVVAALLCAFFTVFTGGSGVTILALGGLLFQALTADRYRERFSLGLLTASGSLGLLLPPALPLILYGIVASISIEQLFLGGILPGFLLIALIAAWGVREGLTSGAGRVSFAWPEVRRALWGAKWELALPPLILFVLFRGIATLVETSAIAAAYALLVQTVVHRDVRSLRALAKVFRECNALIGGVLIILGVSLGLTSWLVDAQVPAQLLDWVKASIDSRIAFLLLLNVFLLVVGCLMDIFSATVVVVPLIVPLGEAFGIHPVHLGILFVANLELGYLTPPVGLNLFLASYRFEKPLLEVYRAALPMLVILGVGVLLITFVPWMTTALL